MKLKTKAMTYEMWCRFNDLDATELDSNYPKYLDWKEEQWKLNQPTITDTELALVRAFAQGYINALVEHNNVWEGFDEFYAYDDKWDVNIHMNGRTSHDSCGCPPAVAWRGWIFEYRYATLGCHRAVSTWMAHRN
jgi:hypothetical protein